VQRKRWIKPGLAAAVAAAAATATLLALAGGGQAASPNICKTASTSSVDATCVTEQVVPHVLTAGGDAVSATTFTNESGVGGATASHVALSVTFPGTVTVGPIKMLVDGAVVSNSCTSSTQVVSCSFGSIIGGGKAEMIVRFSTSTQGRLEGAASYGEGGNDSNPHPNTTVNDTQVAHDTLAIAAGGTAAGDCFDAADFVNNLVTVQGSTALQLTKASVGHAASQNLPCTPASAGVDTDSSHRPQTFSQNVSFVEFSTITGNATGTVTIDFFATLPKAFVLREWTPGTDLTVGTNWPTVLPCVSGLPQSGQDSCIASKKNLPKGGLEYILNVLGSSFDPRYGG
jgi:hypothetical protein